MVNKNSTQASDERWWDLLAVVLLIAAMLTATFRLVATRWTADLTLVPTVALFGVILGLALGKSIFSQRWVFIFALLYGLFVVPWQLGLTMERGIDWNERLISMSGRLQNILTELVNRELITDNFLFLSLMACLFWIIAVHAGYTLLRYAHPWRIIIPAGLAVFIIHSFDPYLARQSWYLAFYLFFGLLLLARVVYIKNRQKWVKKRTHIPPDVGFDLSRFAFMTAMVVILFAWNAPVLADVIGPAARIWQTASQPWFSIKDRFSYAFASLRASVGFYREYYGDTLALGRGNRLSDHVVMEITGPRAAIAGSRYYWRARVYDQYANNNWKSTQTEKRDLTPNSLDLVITGGDVRESAEFTFKLLDPVSTVFVVPQLLWVSRPAEATLSTNLDGTVDVSTVRANSTIRPGEQYQVRAALTTVTVSQLQEAGSDYPDWVVDRYLQLPDNITPRTVLLAQSIATGYDNAYDVAQAVTDYLRENIKYIEIIPEPPVNQERIDWFLFDLREGFCNYYASAEVVLLRSLGIPARIAVGYNEGERTGGIEEALPPGVEIPEPDRQLMEDVSFVVRQKNLHSWPEVFFPGIGWVEFEPTSSQAPIIRSSGDLNVNSQEQGNERNLRGPERTPQEDFPEIPDGGGFSLQNPPSLITNIAFWFGIIFIFCLIGFVIWQKRRGVEITAMLFNISNQIPIKLEKGLLKLGLQPPKFLVKWANYASLPGLSRSYLEVNRALRRLGNSTAFRDTPADRVDQLASVLPQTLTPGRALLNEYQLGIYSTHEADEALANKAGTEIRKLSILARIQRLIARFQEPRRDNVYRR